MTTPGFSEYFQKEIAYRAMIEAKKSLPRHWKPLRGVSRTILSVYPRGAELSVTKVSNDLQVSRASAGQSLLRLSRLGYVSRDNHVWIIT